MGGHLPARAHTGAPSGWDPTLGLVIHCSWSLFHSLTLTTTHLQRAKPSRAPLLRVRSECHTLTSSPVRRRKLRDGRAWSLARAFSYECVIVPRRLQRDRLYGCRCGRRRSRSDWSSRLEKSERLAADKRARCARPCCHSSICDSHSERVGHDARTPPQWTSTAPRCSGVEPAPHQGRCSDGHTDS